LDVFGGSTDEPYATTFGPFNTDEPYATTFGPFNTDEPYATTFGLFNTGGPAQVGDYSNPTADSPDQRLDRRRRPGGGQGRGVVPDHEPARAIPARH
jgi:hypothetical protein